MVTSWLGKTCLEVSPSLFLSLDDAEGYLIPNHDATEGPNRGYLRGQLSRDKG